MISMLWPELDGINLWARPIHALLYFSTLYVALFMWTGVLKEAFKDEFPDYLNEKATAWAAYIMTPGLIIGPIEFLVSGYMEFQIIVTAYLFWILAPLLKLQKRKERVGCIVVFFAFMLFVGFLTYLLRWFVLALLFDIPDHTDQPLL